MCRNCETQNEFLSEFLEFYYGYKLLQYTGLKDKNGFEVYDGDIINIHNHSWSGINFIVKYDERRASYVFSDESETNGTFTLECSKILEVIGNIYKNPELLEKK